LGKTFCLRNKIFTLSKRATIDMCTKV